MKPNDRVEHRVTGGTGTLVKLSKLDDYWMVVWDGSHGIDWQREADLRVIDDSGT